MIGDDDPLDPVLERTRSSTEGGPALVTGLGAWGIVGPDGDLTWSREARGAVYDWGGVYAQGFRLTGPWRLGVDPGPGEPTLGPTLLERTVRRSRVESVHRTAEIDLLQTVLVPPDGDGIARRLELRSRVERPVRVRLRSAFTAYLAPVLVEGLRPYAIAVRPDEGAVRATAIGAQLIAEGDVPPDSTRLAGRPLTGVSTAGPEATIEMVWEIDVPAGGAASRTLLVRGGLERGGASVRSAPVDSRRWTEASTALWSAWVSGTPTLEFPDAPELTQGYALARGALRALYDEPEPALRGLRAGYPWYATTWGRDLAWMLPAVLWMNDALWAADALGSMLRFQAPSRLPLLGAEAGELPMQVSPGPLLLYGTSDTTLYYPERIARLQDHTGGDAAYLDAGEGALDRFRSWIDAKSDPATGLITNGGEVEGMRDATAGAGRVAYGIDSPDTTIWDSADRRDHAVELQVLGYAAERALGRFAEARGREGSAREARSHADRLAAAVRERYRWPAERYLLDSLGRDGHRVERLRPNALLAVAPGLIEGAGATELVDRAAEPDLATPWGLRTLSARDPEYDPAVYHAGQVWPIATGWAARAALEAGRVDLGAGWLAVLARAYLAERGLANECYRGDRAEPFNSCCLLGLSIGPFLQTLFEGLWGLRPDATHDRVAVRPAFPAAWRSARLAHVRLGAGSLRLDWTPEELAVGWTGPRPLTVDLPEGPITAAPSSVTRLPRAHSS